MELLGKYAFETDELYFQWVIFLYFLCVVLGFYTYIVVFRCLFLCWFR